jgi:hypothetical protein
MDDGGASSRATAIPMITKNCVAPIKEIFTRTPGAPQERFITFIMADRELKCRAQIAIVHLIFHLFLKLFSV